MSGDSSVLENVKVHVPQKDRPEIARFALAAADHPWDVASVSEGFVISGALWEKQFAGATVGHHLQQWQEGVALPEAMTPAEIEEAAARAAAPDSNATPPASDETDEGGTARKTATRKPKG